MATGKKKRKTAKKGTRGAVKNPARSAARPPRREDSERVAAARRIYADEESILKADAADEGVDGTRKRTPVDESAGSKSSKRKEAGGSGQEGKAKSLKPEKSGSGRAAGTGVKSRTSEKSGSGRAASTGAKDRKPEKSEAGRLESTGARLQKSGESGASFENAVSETVKNSRIRSESSEETGKSPVNTKAGRKGPGQSGNGKRQPNKSAKAKKAEKHTAEARPKKTSEKSAGAPETVKAPEKRAAGTASKKISGKRTGASETAKKPLKRTGVQETVKRPPKRAGVPAAEKPFKMPSGKALIRELRQAVHFDKKVFAGVLCAVVIVSIILINITELEGISHQPLTDVSAGHDALANQMMKDLTEKTQSISAIEDAERAEAEAAERAAMEAEAYEAQLAAQQAAYDAAHGDENDLYNTMEVRDPDELRMTLVQNNAYAIGDSMIEGMNDGQYVNTENLIFKRGCGTYDSLGLFERAVNLQASIVWVQLGLNDMDMYITDVGQFKDNYRKLVLYLQENLPDCRIFLCNINPISPDACRRHPQYEYAGQYNQAIMELCEELGVTYVDNTTLVLGHPELWDTDGIHPVQDVYLWILSHMCYEAGI